MPHATFIFWLMIKYSYKLKYTWRLKYSYPKKENIKHNWFILHWMYISIKNCML